LPLAARGRPTNEGVAGSAESAHATAKAPVATSSVFFARLLNAVGLRRA
jgi:hypothetical protein